MAAQEVDRRQLQGTGANATLGLLKDLGTERVRGGRRARKTVYFFLMKKTTTVLAYIRQHSTQSRTLLLALRSPGGSL